MNVFPILWLLIGGKTNQIILSYILWSVSEGTFKVPLKTCILCTWKESLVGVNVILFVLLIHIQCMKAHSHLLCSNIYAQRWRCGLKFMIQWLYSNMNSSLKFSNSENLLTLYQPAHLKLLSCHDV